MKKNLSLTLLMSLLIASIGLENSMAEENKSNKKNVPQNSETKSSNNNFQKLLGEKVSLGLFTSYQRSEFSFDTPAGHSILKWREMEGYSVGSEIKYKVLDLQSEKGWLKGNDLFFSYTYSNLRGEGTDDDISNYTEDSYVSAFSVQKAKGTVNDFRFGSNFDFEKFETFTPSLRLGAFYKKLKFDMNDGNSVAVNYYNKIAGNYRITGLGQRTESEFSGLTIGGKISSKNNDSENALIVDLYPAVSYFGRQYWPQRDPEDRNWKLSDAQPGFGFKVAYEHYFKALNQNFKIFSSYESIRVNKLNEKGDYYSVKGGSAYSEAKGNAKFNSFMFGLGIYF